MAEPHDDTADEKATMPREESTGSWHRMHPLTPVVRSWRMVVTVVTLLLLRSEDAMRNVLQRLVHADEGDSSGNGPSFTDVTGHPRVAFLVLGGLLLVLALMLFVNWIWWRASSYRLTEDSVEVRRGIISKQHRHARLERVQAVDLQQPFVPRLLGLAQLSFDVSGGHRANLEISFLKRAQAEQLRETVLARVRQAKDEAGGRPSDVPGSDSSPLVSEPTDSDAPSSSPRPASPTRTTQRTVGSRLVAALAREGADVAEDVSRSLSSTFAAYGLSRDVPDRHRIVHVPPHRIILAGLLRFQTIVAALWFLGAATALGIGVGTGQLSQAWPVAFPLVLTGFTIISATVRSSLREANFSAALTSDGLVITQGILSTERRVVALDRLQAVGLTQPLLWRPFGWWRVQYNIATAGARDAEGSDHLLLPVGSLDDAVTMAALALPNPASDTSDAESRTGRLLHAALSASGAATEPELFTAQPRSSRWVDPLTWRSNGWSRSEELTVIRSGRFSRTVACIPHARVQCIGLRVGPVERRLGLSTVRLHSTSGPVNGTIRHQQAEIGRNLMFEAAEVARAARERETAR